MNYEDETIIDDGRHPVPIEWVIELFEECLKKHPEEREYLEAQLAQMRAEQAAALNANKTRFPTSNPNS